MEMIPKCEMPASSWHSRVHSVARPALPDRPLCAGRTEPLGSRSGIPGLGPSGYDPSRVKNLCPSPGAVGPASRLRRRYADAPAATLLTGLGTGEWPRFRSAHAPCLDEGAYSPLPSRPLQATALGRPSALTAYPAHWRGPCPVACATGKGTRGQPTRAEVSREIVVRPIVALP
jgi:hypothetical protein